MTSGLCPLRGPCASRKAQEAYSSFPGFVNVALRRPVEPAAKKRTSLLGAGVLYLRQPCQKSVHLSYYLIGIGFEHRVLSIGYYNNMR
jgi:hypothetical protein